MQRLGAVTSHSLGYLFGLMHDGSLLVVGCCLQLDDDGRSLSKARLHFPGEVDLCGFVVFSTEAGVEHLESLQQVSRSCSKLHNVLLT